MIDIFIEKGPYMALAPHVVLAHLKEENAKQFGLSITTLSKGVYFGHEEHDPIRILIMFVANEETVQTNLLNELLEKLLDREIIQKLKNATNIEDIKRALI